MRNVFISGGAGFIGGHLTARLLDGIAQRVVVYDNFSSGGPEHLVHLQNDARLTVIQNDIQNLHALTEAMIGADIVFHLASNPDISKAATQPDIDFWQGTYLTQNVLEAMRVQGVKRIVYTSGSGVYGERRDFPFPEDYGPLAPISTYAASKIAGEALISSYCHMFDMTAVVFRFANVVGPGQTHGVGYDFLHRLAQNPNELTILGDGTQSKSYIHVDDVLEAVLLCEQRTETRYEIYNVATQDHITVREIADAALEVIGLDKESVRYRFTGGDRGWKGDVPVIRFDLRKIQALGWTACRSSREAIRASLEGMWGRRKTQAV